MKAHKNATIFHTIEWKKVLEETFNFEPEYLVVKNLEGKVVGISPAFNVKTLFGKVIVSQPFFEYGGPIVEKEFVGAYDEILSYYRNKVEDGKIKYVEIKVIPDAEYKYERFDKIGFVKQFKAYDFYIDIKGKNFENDIWLNLYTKKNRIRNSIRKAEKNGMIVINKNNIGIYYDLYLKTVDRLGSPPFPKTLFENINKYASSLVRFTYAYLNELPLAALMSFPCNKRDLMVGLVSDENYQEYRANDYLYNEQIKYAIEKKFDTIDFGRTRPNSTYERYKSKWGSTKIDLYSYVYPSHAKRNVDPYRYYLLFSSITKKIPWIFTKTKIGPYLAKKFP